MRYTIHQLVEPTHPRVDVDRPFRGFRQRLQQGANETAVALEKLRARTRDSFDQDPHASRRLRHLPDHGHGADAVQIVGGWLVAVAMLKQEQHHAIAGKRAIDRFDRNRPTDAERRHGHR
jgi:hypothetical protein